MKRVVIIAEAGVNHNGDITIAKKLIDEAAKAKVDFVKFQTFKAAHLVSKKAKKADYQIKNIGKQTDDTQFKMLQQLELSKNDHYELIKYAKSKKVKFFSTAFDMESLYFLIDLKLGLFKIPSGEITNLPYLKLIGKQNKPVILSTGMSSLGEIEMALAVLIDAGTKKENITVLHCNTEYPTPMSDVNLKAMLSIRDAFKVNIGYSDHTNGIEVPIAAVALGATVIEKHFTLNRNMEGPDHRASLEPQELRNMVSAIRNIELAISGNGVKQASESEIKNLSIARKSIHAVKDLLPGKMIKETDLIMKRPGDGISPMDMEKVIGRKVIAKITKDEKLKWNQLA